MLIRRPLDAIILPLKLMSQQPCPPVSDHPLPAK